MPHPIHPTPQQPLDALVCNAAVYLPAKPVPTFTPDGIEESLQINHLSHFLLVSLLLDDLKKAKDPRCVIVGSITVRFFHVSDAPPCAVDGGCAQA